MVRILDLTLVKQILLPTAIALVTLVVLYLIGDFFSLGMELLDERPPLSRILEYGTLQALYMGSFLLPLALLVGTFWGCCEWRQNREWIASLGSGRHPISLLRGPLIVILLFAVVLLGISWFVMADLSRSVQNLRDHDLTGANPSVRQIFRNVNLQLIDERSIRIDRLDLSDQRMTGVTVFQEQNGTLRARWDSGEIRFDHGTGWQGENIVFREFSNGRLENETVLDRESFPLESPGVLRTVLEANPRTTDRRPEGYSVNELRTMIDFHQRRSSPATVERAHLHWKISFPLIAVLFGLYGIGLGTRTRLNKPAGLGFCLAGVFVYMVLHSFLFAWFQNLTVPPELVPMIPYLAAYGTPVLASIGLGVGHGVTDQSVS